MTAVKGKALVVGATSDIAEACIRRLAAMGWRLHLIGRDSTRLDVIAKDAVVRGGDTSHDADPFTALASIPDLVDRSITALGGNPDLVLIATGSMPQELVADANRMKLVQEVIEANFTVPVAVVEALIGLPGCGSAMTIGVICSVAGDRPRGRMAIYGGAKGGLAAYLEGIRHRLAGTGPRLITLKLGPVRTRMTAHLGAAMPMADRDETARAILRTLARGREGVTYHPGIYRVVMMVIRALPSRLFRRIKA